MQSHIWAKPYKSLGQAV